MPSPYQAMEMVMRHFPNAELVEHLPIQQGFVNAMLNNSIPISTTGFVCEFRIPVAGNNVIKVIAKIDWHGNLDWTVYEWELLGTFDEKAYDQAYDQWYETSNAYYPNDTAEPYKGWGDELC